jgi:hypothetical protein
MDGALLQTMMEESIHIPMFPLTLLPLAGELVPLHIFEPRYQQLLQDAETTDLPFGIYCNHDLNKQRIGSLMKLESVIKRYPGGESDVIVRCTDSLTMEKLYRTFKSKKYPGGDVRCWLTDPNELPNPELYERFIEYQDKRNITAHFTTFTVSQIAVELNFDLFDRYKFLSMPKDRQQPFLNSHLKFQLHLLNEAQKSKDLFYLN